MTLDRSRIDPQRGRAVSNPATKDSPAPAGSCPSLVARVGAALFQVIR